MLHETERRERERGVLCLFASAEIRGRKWKEIKTREMPIYDRNESIITEKIQFVK